MCKEEGHSAKSLHGLFSIRSRSLIASPSFHCINRRGGNSRSVIRFLAPQEGSSSSYDGNAEENIWQRVQLLQRLLDVSITEENYSQAKTIHNQLTDLKAQLSEAEKFLFEKIGNLAKGSINDRTEVIADLGDTGDKRVLPMLVDGLFDSNPAVASETEKAMWKIFMHSGREDVDQRLQEGLSLLLSKDLPAARDIFTEVIEMAPSFAEGWNKRATANYLLKEYQESIKDCEQTLELNPYHFGALSGMGLCYAAMNDSESALSWFKKAYAMHPGLVQINKFIKMLNQKRSESNEGGDKNDENPL